jgi:hypothetical protein
MWSGIQQHGGRHVYRSETWGLQESMTWMLKIHSLWFFGTFQSSIIHQSFINHSLNVPMTWLCLSKSTIAANPFKSNIIQEILIIFSHFPIFGRFLDIWWYLINFDQLFANFSSFFPTLWAYMVTHPGLGPGRYRCSPWGGSILAAACLKWDPSVVEESEFRIHQKPMKKSSQIHQELNIIEPNKLSQRFQASSLRCPECR